MSLEDRPFIPQGMVVLEGTPINMKNAFRKWDVKMTTTRSCGGEATVVELNAALEAVARGDAS